MSLFYQFEVCNSDGWTTTGKDVQYKVVGDTLYFQCSHGKSDWFYNFKASESVYKDSDIEFIGHKGFNELWESVRHEIEGLKFSKIVGYSQGAALAIRAHENYFHRMGFEPDVTITFGCPASIKRPKGKLLNRFVRVVNYHNPHDIVFWLPMLIGYKHVGASIALTNKAKRPKGFNLVSWLTGHSPEEYRQRLENA